MIRVCFISVETHRPEGLKNGQILRENLTALARGASVGTFHPSTHLRSNCAFQLKHTHLIYFPKPMDISQTIHLLGDLLGQVISELESPLIFEIEERIRALAKARRSGDLTSAVSLQQEVSSLKTEEARAVPHHSPRILTWSIARKKNQRVCSMRRHEDEKYPEPIPDPLAMRFDSQKRGISRTSGRFPRIYPLNW